MLPHFLLGIYPDLIASMGIGGLNGLIPSEGSGNQTPPTEVLEIRIEKKRIVSKFCTTNFSMRRTFIPPHIFLSFCIIYKMPFIAFQGHQRSDCDFCLVACPNNCQATSMPFSKVHDSPCFHLFTWLSFSLSNPQPLN